MVYLKEHPETTAADFAEPVAFCFVAGEKEISMSGQPGRSGRKTFVPTADQRNTVKIMARLGIPEDKICLTVINPQTNKPISKPTLQRAFRNEIATGQTELTTLVGTALVDAALGERPRSGEPIKSDAARVNARCSFWNAAPAGSGGCSSSTATRPVGTAMRFRSCIGPTRQTQSCNYANLRQNLEYDFAARGEDRGLFGPDR